MSDKPIGVLQFHPMTKFEFYVLSSHQRTVQWLQQELNKLGKDGWDYCFMTGTSIIFKRPIIEPA